MAKHRVHVIRSGSWWAIEFPDVDERIHSQAKRLDLVPAMAAEAISLWRADEGADVDPEDIEVVPILEGELNAMVTAARASREQAETLADEARHVMAAAAARAKAAGLTVRDVGELLGVSYQYAARLMQAA